MAAASWGLLYVSLSLVLLLPLLGELPPPPDWTLSPLTSCCFSCHSMVLDAPPILKTPVGQDGWVNWDEEFAYGYIQAQMEAKVTLWMWWKLRLGPAPLVHEQCLCHDACSLWLVKEKHILGNSDLWEK